MLLFPLRSKHALKVPILQQGILTPVLKQVTSDTLSCFGMDMGSSKLARGRSSDNVGIDITPEKPKPAEKVQRIPKMLNYIVLYLHTRFEFCVIYLHPIINV